MFVYLILCEDNSYYTGIAKMLKKRLSEHYLKKSVCAKYTKSHKMKNLEIFFETNTKSTACKLEYKLKTLTHTQKQNLISGKSSLDELFPNQFSECDIKRASQADIQKINSELQGLQNS